MKRNDYQKPTMKVVQLKHRTQMLTASVYETTGSGKTSITMMGEEEEL